MDLSNLDPEVRDVFSRAYATFRERTTTCPEWADRKPFVGPGRNTTPDPINKPLTLNTAFAMFISAKEQLDRNEQPASARDVLSIWQDYRYQYVENPAYPLPADELASMGLSMLVLRDVFCDVQKYITRGRYPRSKASARKKTSLFSIKDIISDASLDPAPTPTGNPYVPLLETARRKAKHLKSAQFDLRKARDYLRKEGFFTQDATVDELRDMQRASRETEMYPRTYL